jgi:hypothetical protein
MEIINAHKILIEKPVRKRHYEDLGEARKILQILGMQHENLIYVTQGTYSSENGSGQSVANSVGSLVSR